MGDQVKRPMSRLWSLMVDWKKFRFRITFKLILPVYDALKPSNCSRTPSFINKMLCLNRSASPLDKTLTLMKARVRAQVSFEEELDEMRWDEIPGQERPHHFNRFQLHNHTIKPRRNVKFLTEKCRRKQFEFSCEKGLENQRKNVKYTWRWIVSDKVNQIEQLLRFFPPVKPNVSIIGVRKIVAIMPFSTSGPRRRAKFAEKSRA